LLGNPKIKIHQKDKYNLMNKLSWLFLILLFYVAVTPNVYATEEDEAVNLSEFPVKLSELMTIPLFAAQLLASSIVLALFLLPTVFACSKFSKDVTIPALLVGFGALGFCIAMGWLPYWFLLVLALVVALLFAGSMRDWIGGKG